MALTSDPGVELPAPELLRRFDVPGPRYTSYPTADRFVDAFGANAFAAWLDKRAAAIAPPPLSLYVHLPFCDTVCYYCACNKVVTRDRGRTAGYLDFLAREVDLVGARFNSPQPVEQLHLGGGTPTFLNDDELARLMDILLARFPMSPRGEYGVEVDPRSTPPDKVRTLARLGFNRMSVGVQDFEPEVQAAVNRIQSFELTRATILEARAAGMLSVNMDLIYGLPRQSRATFQRTLDQVLTLEPDRIALYHYAHLPERFKPQRRIEVEQLPSSEEKLGIMIDAIKRLTDAGYRYIGMDHFAKADDALARAQSQGRLHRNFQGYSTRADCDLIGLGVSAISKVGPTYSQNERDLDEYYDRLSNKRLPTARGILLDRDDLVRRGVIMALMCHFELSKEAIETAHLVRFDDYFKRELDELRSFEDAGLIEVTREWLTVTPAGKLLIRPIAMVFDSYLRQDQRNVRYSKVV